MTGGQQALFPQAAILLSLLKTVCPSTKLSWKLVLSGSDLGICLAFFLCQMLQSVFPCASILCQMNTQDRPGPSQFAGLVKIMLLW